MPDARAIMAEVAAEAAASEAGEAGQGAEPAPAATAEKKPDPPAETPEQTRLRKAMGAVARREQKVLAREQAAKAAEGEARAFADLRSKARSSPLELLSAFGFSGVDDFADAIMSAKDGKQPTADDRVSALEKRLEAEAATRKDAEQKATIAAAKRQLAEEIKAAGDEYDLINTTGNHDLVWDTAQAYFDEHGVAPDMAETARAVEKHLEDELLERASKSKKFLARVGAVKQPAPASKVTAPQQPRPGAVTLTNNDTPEVPPSADDFPDDPRERFKAVTRSIAGRV
jgi:hypothetical protein